MSTEPELAIGAITTGNVCVLNSDVLQENGIEISDIEDAVEEERRELERLQQLFRGPRPAEDVRQRPVILVDDGLATGVNMRAAIAVLRAQGPTSITVAVPVGSRTACEQISSEVDEFICPRIPEPFYAVGVSYDQFPRMCDEDIHSVLEKEEHERSLHDGISPAIFTRAAPSAEHVDALAISRHRQPAVKKRAIGGMISSAASSST